MPTFDATISGFNLVNQKIDLGDVLFTSGGTASWSQTAPGISGTLTVSEGAQTAVLTLAGAYVTSNFVLSEDQREGGTYISDPPVTRFVQGMAAFGGGAGAGAGATPPAPKRSAWFQAWPASRGDVGGGIGFGGRLSRSSQKTHLVTGQTIRRARPRRIITMV